MKKILVYTGIIFLAACGRNTASFTGAGSNLPVGNKANEMKTDLVKKFKTDSAVYVINYQPAEMLLKQELRNKKLSPAEKKKRLVELKGAHHFQLVIKTRNPKKPIPEYFFGEFANDIVLASGYDSIHPSFYLPVLSGNLKGGFDILLDFPVSSVTKENYQLVVTNKQFHEKFKSEFNINAINTRYESSNVQ